jgi:PEP-CTERM motif
MGNSNSGLAGPITGVKFEFGGSSPYTFSFDSNRAPVWGDIYIKGGSTSYAVNKGVTLHGSSMNTLDFVARPNGTAVPEPSSIVLVGLCGAGVAWRRLRWLVRAS